MSADAIVVKGLRALGRHGVLPEERERAQPFDVDLEIELPLAAAGQRDDLTETVDYGQIVTAVVRVVETGSYRLLEALAGAIAEEVLRNGLVEAVTVEVRKVRPPVAANLESVGVRLRRGRAPTSAPPPPLMPAEGAAE